MKYIYPEIQIRPAHRDARSAVFTELRVEHEGKYYLQSFVVNILGSVESALLELHRNIYLYQQLGKVDMNAKHSFNEQPFFTEDEDQTPEKERVRNRYCRSKPEDLYKPTTKEEHEFDVTVEHWVVDPDNPDEHIVFTNKQIRDEKNRD